MNTEDQGEFDAQLEALCAGHDKPCTEARRTAFWKGLSKMSLIQFGRVVEHCLSEDGPEKMPTVPGIWVLWRQIRDRGRAHAPQKASGPDPDISAGMQAVNQLFIRYLGRRRLTEGFKGDLNMAARREECIRLSRWVDAMIMDGMRPDPDDIEVRFDAAMLIVRDGTTVAA